MKNYFHILGLEPGATEDQIRKAFRMKAKQLHPDVNREPDARHQFIEVQQAYAFLINTSQRLNYEALLSRQKMSRSEQDRREEIYKLWVEHQQRKARTRRAMEEVHKSRPLNPFSKGFWHGLNLLYNLVFLVLFVGMIFLPINNYIDQLEKPAHMQRSIVYFIIPSLLGVVFLVYGYYYWFVLKSDRE